MKQFAGFIFYFGMQQNNYCLTWRASLYTVSDSLSLSLSLFLLGALWNAFEMHLTNGQMRRGYNFWNGLHPGWERPSDLSLRRIWRVESPIWHSVFRRGKCIPWSPQTLGVLVCMHWKRAYVEYTIPLHWESSGS